MSDYTRQLKQLLRDHDCRYVRPRKGDHEIWYSPRTNTKLPGR